MVNIDKVPPGQTPTQYYNVLFDNLNKPYGFHKITVDNIPAAFGFANDEVLVDTGNATIIIASLSTVSGTDNGKDSEKMAAIVVNNFCAKISCVK